jgi:hypothetical protein
MSSIRDGLYYVFGLVDGDPIPVRWHCGGTTEPAMRRWVERRVPWALGDPRVSDPRWNQRFVPLHAMGDPEKLFYPTQFFRELYELAASPTIYE